MKKSLNKYFLLFHLFLIPFSSFSQELDVAKIQGKVLNKGKLLEYAFVELINLNHESLISSITDKNGFFKFEREIKDSLIYVKASFYSLKSVTQKVKIPRNKIINIEIALDEPNIENLDEVLISTDQTKIEKVDKSIYKIRSKDYLINASSLAILNNVPRLSFDEQKGLLIENRLEGKTYIDGLESSLQFLRTLEISEIDKVEVITTPSAKFGSEFTGGIINIITKNNSENFIKGSLDGGVGLLRKSYNMFPNLSLKTEDLIIKTFYSVLDNKQEISYAVDRSESELYHQISFKRPNIIQQWGGLQSKYNISDQEFVYANFSISKAAEKALQRGEYSDNSDSNVPFNNEEKSDFNRTNINIVYEKMIEKDELFIKAKSYWYERNNDFLLNEIGNKTKSKLKEFSGEIYYDLNEKTLFHKPISYSLGVKIINRNSDSHPVNLNFNQKILSSYAEYNYTITENLSSYISLQYENTHDENTNAFNNHYNTFLPTIILNRKLKNSLNLNYSFTKKIKRPSVYFLNSALVFLNPGVANKGNNNLKPQKNYSHQFTITKKIKKINLTLSSYYDYLKDAVAYNSNIEEGILINFYDNIGKVQKIGANFSFNSKLFNKVNTNLSTAIQYNKYELLSTSNALINDGYSYSLSLSTSTKIIKDKLSITYYLNQKSPLYDLTTRTKSNPYTYLMLSTNLFKNRLRVNLTYSDILNINSKKEIDLRNQNIVQNTIIDNKLSNINIGFSFNFGKKFSDYIKKKDIKNDDLMGN